MSNKRFRLCLNGFVSTFILFVFVSIPAHALNSLTCQNTLITLKTSLGEVLLRCGDPHKRSTWQESAETQKTLVSTSTTPESHQHIVTKSSREQKNVEELIYNFGASDFLYLLKFENGVLVKIETSGYGF